LFSSINGESLFAAERAAARSESSVVNRDWDTLTQLFSIGRMSETPSRRSPLVLFSEVIKNFIPLLRLVYDEDLWIFNDFLGGCFLMQLLIHT
jgi:hypothetical protein